MLANTLLDWLEFKGYEAVHVANGNEALERMKAETYDIIVLDWNIPGITGIEVCTKYRASGGTLPVLMLTGRQGSTEESQCKTAGATRYLAKPFQLDELTSQVQQLLTVDMRNKPLES